MLVLDGVEMLDVRETAEVVGRTPETVRRWIWSGRLTARRHGNKLLVSRAAIDQLAGSASARPETLRGWASAVAAQRRAGGLGAATRGTSAADLVLDDRTGRQAG